MRKLNLLLLLSMLFVVSCATNKDSNRYPAATSNAKAIKNVVKSCDLSRSVEKSLIGLVNENAVPNEARKLTGGKGFQTFLMEDGRLVVVSLADCDIDHLKIDEGKITSTFANGRRLYMTVQNTRGNGRVYVMTAVKNQSANELYQVHEIKYDHRRFANAVGFKRKTVATSKGNKYGVAILHRDGHLYSYKREDRVFRPWEWGGNNETIDRENAVRISLIPARPAQRVVVIQRPRVETRRPTVTYLPKPPKTCRVEDKISFFFGLISFSTEVEVPCL